MWAYVEKLIEAFLIRRRERFARLTQKWVIIRLQIS